MNAKAIVAGATALALVACAPNTFTMTDSEELEVICRVTYPEALNKIAQQIRLETVSDASIKRVDTVKGIVGPICRGEVDADASSLLEQAEAVLIIMAAEEQAAKRKAANVEN